jgi:hypothetical protein
VKARLAYGVFAGVKDPALADTNCVVGLVAPGVVNTMPEKTPAPRP